MIANVSYQYRKKHLSGFIEANWFNCCWFIVDIVWFNFRRSCACPCGLFRKRRSLARQLQLLPLTTSRDPLIQHTTINVHHY